MSHSQFQSKIFILRHAWLNLWDERMTTGRINQVAIHVTPHRPAKLGYCQVTTSLRVGQTIPASAVQVLPVATVVLCSNSQWRPLLAGHFQLPVRPCSRHHHPNNKHSRLDAKLQNHLDRQCPEVQFSIPVANLLSQERYHQTIGLQFTPTHCERANQHPLLRLKETPTFAGTTTKPQAKSKQNAYSDRSTGTNSSLPR